MLGRIKEIIRLKNLTLDSWFDLMDSCGASGVTDGKVTHVELRRGLRLLNIVGEKEKKRREFTENEIVALIRFMDPDADGDLSIEEVKAAVLKTEEETEEEKTFKRVEGVICRLEEYMKKKGIRMSDLFESLDSSGDGTLSPEELIVGLETIADPSKRGRLNAKRKKGPVVKSKGQGEAGNPAAAAAAAAAAPALRVTCVIKVRILDDDSALLQERYHNELMYRSSSQSEATRDRDRVINEAAFGTGTGTGTLTLATNTNTNTNTNTGPTPTPQPSLSASVFLEITDLEIDSLINQVSQIHTFPLALPSLLATISHIPQVSTVLSHLEFMWSQPALNLSIDERMEIARGGSSGISDDHIRKVVAFLDPNGDGVIDVAELGDALRLARRSNAALAAQALARKNGGCGGGGGGKTAATATATRQEALAQRGEQILKEQVARAEEARASKEQALLEKEKYVNLGWIEVRFGKLECAYGGGDDGIRKEVEGVIERVSGRKEREEEQGFTAMELDLLVGFLDPGGDNEITFDELEGAFRRSRRAKAVEKVEKRGRKVLGRIMHIMKVLEMDLETFFDMLDSAGSGKSDGEISSREIKIGVEKLSKMARAKLTREVSGVEWSGVEWSGVEWSGVEWSGVEWSGVEWSGVE